MFLNSDDLNRLTLAMTDKRAVLISLPRAN